MIYIYYTILTTLTIATLAFCGYFLALYYWRVNLKDGSEVKVLFDGKYHYGRVRSRFGDNFYIELHLYPVREICYCLTEIYPVWAVESGKYLD